MKTLTTTAPTTTQPPPVPHGMTVVTEQEFFRLLYADPRDIMPTLRHPDSTTWEVVATRARWGWSTPGWKTVGSHPRVYAVAQHKGAA